MDQLPFIELTLPFPPSVNHYLVKSVRAAKGKAFVHVHVSKKGIIYQGQVLAICLQKRAVKRLTGRLRVDITLYPPDKRKRDVDNYPKVLLDSLTKAGVWEDDEQIDKLTITRAWPRRPEGACVVRISQFSVSSEIPEEG